MFKFEKTRYISEMYQKNKRGIVFFYIMPMRTALQSALRALQGDRAIALCT